jgi:hypothetical protein
MIDRAEMETCLATAAELLSAESMLDAAKLLRRSEASVEEAGYDNWNGGTTIYTIYLRIGAAEYALLGKRREVIESQTNERLNPVFEQRTGDWYSHP